jgi:hypothetical protein
LSQLPVGVWRWWTVMVVIWAKSPLVAVVAVLCLLATACTSGDRSSDEVQLSRIETRLTRLLFENSADQVRFFEVDAEREVVVAECMAAQGWEYAPRPRPTYLLPASDLGDLFRQLTVSDPASWEFRSTYGYGVSTVDAYLHIEYGLAGETWETLDGLDDAAREQYLKALEGDGDGGLGGCRAAAIQSVPFAYTTEDNVFEAVTAAYAHAVDRVQGQTAFVVAETEWHNCAAAAGYSYSSRRQLLEELNEGLNGATRDTEYAVVIEGDGDLPEEVVEELGTSERPSEETSSIYDVASLERLRDEEIRIATDLFSCDVQFDSAIASLMDDAAREVLAESEMVFLDG